MSGPNAVSPENAYDTYRFFAFFFEWVRSPIRRQIALSLTGLPESGSAILHRLEQGGPTSVSALASSLSLDQSTVSRQLEPLRASGLITEEPFADNRRKVRVSVSDAGQEVSDRVARYWIDYWTRVISHLDVDEQQQLVELLGRLHAAIDAEEAEFGVDLQGNEGDPKTN